MKYDLQLKKMLVKSPILLLHKYYRISTLFHTSFRSPTMYLNHCVQYHPAAVLS